MCLVWCLDLVTSLYHSHLHIGWLRKEYVSFFEVSCLRYLILAATKFFSTSCRILRWRIPKHYVVCSYCEMQFFFIILYEALNDIYLSSIFICHHNMLFCFCVFIAKLVPLIILWKQIKTSFSHQNKPFLLSWCF